MAGTPPDLLDRVSDAIVALDRDWRYTFVNAQAAALFGRPPEQLLGRHIWTEFPEGVGQPFHLAYERAMRDQEPAVLEEYYAPWDRWFENRVYPSPDGLTILFHDITDRKRAERGLAAATERLRLLLDGTESGPFEWDMQSDTVQYSPEWKRQLGYQDAEIGTSFEEWRSRVHPEDLPGVMARVERYLARPHGVHEVEFRMRHRDGSWRFILARANVICNETGRPCRMLGLHLDITRLRQAERATLEYAAQLRAMADHSPIGIGLHTPDGVLAYANPALAAINGVSADDLVRKGWPHLLHPADRDRILGALREHIEQRRPVTAAEGRIIRPDGQERILEMRAGRVEEDGRLIGHVAVVQDVTDQRRDQQQLSENYTRLRRLAAGLEQSREAERARIAREIHDELGQQLTGLKMDLAWMLARATGGPAAERLRGMQQLLDDTIGTVRRIASELRPGVLDDLGLGPAARWLAREFGQRSGVAVALNVPDELPVDPDRSTAAFRILQEALTNVARHARAHRVDVSLGVDRGVLRLTVADDGQGMPDPARAGDGSLGILGMRERAEAWGGSVMLASGRDGTSVSVEIPLEPPAAHR